MTHSPAVLQSRKMTLQLLLSDHNMDCLACSRNGNCELQELCKELGVDDTTYFEGEKNEYDIDYSSKHMFRDNNKCIHCRRCIAACDKLQGIGVIGANNRGFKTNIDCAFDLDLAETACVSCGQCITACPTGAVDSINGMMSSLEAMYGGSMAAVGFKTGVSSITSTGFLIISLSFVNISSTLNAC